MRRLNDRLRALLVEWLLEQPAQRQGLVNLRRRLEVGGDRLGDRFAAAAGGEADRQVVRNLIGLERWAQRQLRAALGEEAPHDEIHLYKPPRDADWDELRTTFAATRAATLELADALAAIAPTTVVLHDRFGPMSVLAWLRYLQLQGFFAGRQVRRAIRRPATR